MEQSETVWWGRIKWAAYLLWLVAMIAAMGWLLRSGWARSDSVPAYVSTAYVAMELLGFVAGWILRTVEWDIRRQHQHSGKEIFGQTPGGWWLGFLERALYLGAALLGRWELAAGYLVLKAASQWKAWTTPADSLPFLVSTLGNLVAALGGFGFAELLSGIDELEGSVV